MVKREYWILNTCPHDDLVWPSSLECTGQLSRGPVDSIHLSRHGQLRTDLSTASSETVLLSLYFLFLPLASMSLSAYTFHRKVLSRDTECFWVKTGGNFLLNPLYIPVSMYLTKSFSCLTIGHMHIEESVDTVSRICTSNFSRPNFQWIYWMAINLDFSSLLPFQIQGTGLGSNAWDVWPLHLGLSCDSGYHSHTKQAYLAAKMKITGFYW